MTTNSTSFNMSELNSTNVTFQTVASMLKHSNDPYIYCAYMFLLATHINTKQLYFRLILIGACFSFCLFAIITGYVFVDMLIYNSSFIIINLVRSIALIKEHIPIKLTPLEKKVYARFSTFLNRQNIKQFLSQGNLHPITRGTQITHTGNHFGSLIYIAYIHPDLQVKIFKENQEVGTIQDYGWLGTIQYSNLDQEGNNKWNIESMLVDQSEEQKQEKINQNELRRIQNEKETDQEFLKQLEEKYRYEQEFHTQYPEAGYIYEFPIQNMNDLFNDPDLGSKFKEAIISNWLMYSTKAIEQIDEKLREVTMRKKNAKIENVDYQVGVGGQIDGQAGYSNGNQIEIEMEQQKHQQY